MEIGIVGPPSSGKTTVFNAVTRGRAQVATYSGPQGKPNIGVAKVPDGRLDTLSEIFQPRRLVPAEVTYVDVPAGQEGAGETQGISGAHLNLLQRTDALLAVARGFDNPSVSRDGGVDPFRDIETTLMELAIADLEIVERRDDRLSDSFKGAKAPERETLEKERSLLTRLKADLEGGLAIRNTSLTREEARGLEGFQFLTAKPVVIMVNIDEDQMAKAADVEVRLSSQYKGPEVRTVVLCGSLEMELAQMEPEEERELREGLGAGESGLDRMIRLSQDAGDLITFFTGNSNEVRAWTVPRGTAALKAAGRVHSDFERGFIRAEVIGSDDLADSGSMAEARKRGVLRREGKEYEVQEGDVLNILFSV